MISWEMITNWGYLVTFLGESYYWVGVGYRAPCGANNDFAVAASSFTLVMVTTMMILTMVTFTMILQLAAASSFPRDDEQADPVAQCKAVGHHHHCHYRHCHHHRQEMFGQVIHGQEALLVLCLIWNYSRWPVSGEQVIETSHLKIEH